MRRHKWALVASIALVMMSVAPGATGAAAKAPSLAWSPSAGGLFDFGTLDAATGETATQTFTLSNTDGGVARALSVALSGASTFTLSGDTCSGKNLPPRRSCSVSVRYAPTSNGSGAGTLTASSKNASASLALNGSSAWQAGDLITYSQSLWGDAPEPGNAAELLNANFDSVYASTFGVLELGIPGAAGFSMTFTSAPSVLTYLPAPGDPGPLNADLLNPATSSSGVFGGEVAALQLNIDFSDAGVTAGAAAIPFGDVRMCGSTSALNGQTIRQIAAAANTQLGGATAVAPFVDLTRLIQELNVAFDSGFVGTFAQAHLQPGACPSG